MVEPEKTPAFSLAPAQANLGHTTDHTSSAGLKLHKAATEELPMNFDCDSKNVETFSENNR